MKLIINRQLFGCSGNITANMDVNEDGFIQNWNPTLEDFQESES
jgi:hypothetical protein